MAQGLACASLAWGAFAFGAVYPWAYWPLAIVGAASGVAGLIRSGGVGLPPGGRVLLVALGLIPVAVLVQLVPWPTGVLGTISPRGRDIIEQLDVRFAWQLVEAHGLSLDPAATIRALALYASFGLLMLGLARSFSQAGVRHFIWIVSWLGIALALTAIIQKPLYSGAIYGFWTPLTSGRPFGPFVNRNHFAGWMLMGIPLALGYFCAIFSQRGASGRRTFRDHVIWLSSREASQAMQAGFAALIMGLSLALTLSRSAMLSLAAALIFCGYAGVRRQNGALGRSIIVGALALLAAVIVFWAGTDAVAARFAAADTVALGGRIPVWRGGLHMLGDFWLTGSGLNTYGVATLFYPTVIPDRHLGAAHNEYLQLAVEGGLLVCVPIVLAAAAFALAVRRQLVASQGPSYWIRLGAVGGIVAIAVQSLVEFSLQIPGNAALFATLCALALHRSSRPVGPPVAHP
jgi:hypothetical protein